MGCLVCPCPYAPEILLQCWIDVGSPSVTFTAIISTLGECLFFAGYGILVGDSERNLMKGRDSAVHSASA